MQRGGSSRDVQNSHGGGQGGNLGGSDGGFSKEALERSMAGKDDFFSRKLAENASRPDHLPPNQGGKYVGFGSSGSLSSAPPPGGDSSQLVDEAWNTVSQGISRLSVAAGATVTTVAGAVKPGLQEVSQRYQRGELAGTAVQLVATGADYGLRGLSSLKGLLKTAVSQLEGALDPSEEGGQGGYDQQGAYGAEQHQQQGYQPQPHAAQQGGFSGNRTDSGRAGGLGAGRATAASDDNSSWSGWGDDKDFEPSMPVAERAKRSIERIERIDAAPESQVGLKKPAATAGTAAKKGFGGFDNDDIDWDADWK